MPPLSQALRRPVQHLTPGTKDKLLFWGAMAAGVAGAAVAWLLI